MPDSVKEEYVRYEISYYGQINPKPAWSESWNLVDDLEDRVFYNEEALKDRLRALSKEAQSKGGYITLSHNQRRKPEENETIVVVEKSIVLVPILSGGSWDFEVGQ